MPLTGAVERPSPSCLETGPAKAAAMLNFSGSQQQCCCMQEWRDREPCDSHEEGKGNEIEDASRCQSLSEEGRGGGPSVAGTAPGFGQGLGRPVEVQGSGGGPTSKKTGCKKGG